jgi:hypothetical protein
MKGSSYPTQENKAFWQKLRTYWVSLPTQRRFKVLGCDVEHQSSLAMIHLKKVVESKTDNISQAIKNKGGYDYFLASEKTWALDLLTQLKNNPQSYTPSEYFEIEHILQNLVNTNDVYNDLNNFYLREEKIYGNAKRLFAQFPAEY